MLLRTIAMLALAAAPARAEPSTRRIGLAPDVAALASAEALTGSARGGAALMYNPAGLARGVWGLKLAEYYNAVDQAAIDTSRHLQRASQRGENPDLGAIWALVGSGDKLSFELGATVLDAQVPFVGARGFAYAVATLAKQKDAAGAETYDFELASNIGAAAGLPFITGRWSMGFSRYYLVRSELAMTPSAAAVHAYADQAAAGTLAADAVPYHEFTKLRAGNGLGSNFGLLWQPWDDNPTGVGLAVLNVGGTPFVRRSLVSGQRAEKASQSLDRFAARYALTVENPQPLRQMTNLGATLGAGGATADLYSAALSVDYHDIGRDTLQFKLAGAGELEGWLPMPVATLLSAKYVHDKRVYRFGLYGAHALAGIQEGEYSSYAFGVVLHGGIDAISPLKVTVDHYVYEGFGVNAGQRRQGFGASVGITFVF